MARRTFKYKGYTLEELQAMSMDEVVGIMPSRTRRTLSRGFTDVQKKLMRKIRKTRKQVDGGEKTKPIRTHCRNMPIIPEMIGLDFEVYNGKEFIRIHIKPEMIGQYLGEFSATRNVVKHSAPGVGATRSSLFVPVR